MQKVSIRYATARDFAQLEKLSKTAWLDWWKENPKFGEEYVKDRIKGKKTLVAIVDGVTVGYLVYGSIWSRHWHIEDVYIKPKYRRLGLGSALMERLIVLAKKNGIRKLVGEEDVGNRIAYKYNIKHGFKKAGYVKRLWGNTDAFVFIKDLR